MSLNVLTLQWNLTGEKEKLLWLFTSDADLRMMQYMNGLPGITDPVMNDGSTAFFIALGRQKWDLIQELLSHKREQDVRLAKYALFEPKLKNDLKVKIEAFLKQIGTTIPEKPEWEHCKE